MAEISSNFKALRKYNKDIREIGQNARETIPVSWEKLMPMVLAEYRAVIDRYEKKR